jgi:hypothetical protein
VRADGVRFKPHPFRQEKAIEEDGIQEELTRERRTRSRALRMDLGLHKSRLMGLGT